MEEKPKEKEDDSHETSKIVEKSEKSDISAPVVASYNIKHVQETSASLVRMVSRQLSVDWVLNERLLTLGERYKRSEHS